MTSMSDEVNRLSKLRAEIIEERKKLKEEKAASASTVTGIIDAVSLNITYTGIKMYTMDGRLINSITWTDLDEMRKQARPDTYLATEGRVSPQVLFRETFQNFLEFCNTLYLPPEVEKIPPDIINNPNIDPNTRAFLDLIVHYENHFEKNEQWKRPFTRFLKWMCYLFKEDSLIRERLGWMFWWFIVKHGNKLIMWEPIFDPRHWNPFSEEDMMRTVEGPQITTPLTEEQKMENQRKNEELMQHGQGAT